MTQTRKKPNLLVPIHLDALIVNNNEQLFKDVSLDIDGLNNTEGYGGLGYYLQKSITDGGNTNESTIANGIHLHWVLPDAFRRGKYNDGGSLVFPNAPNRWLVLRMDAAQQIKLWIIESDCKNNKANAKPNWIKESTGPDRIAPIQIGNVVDFDSWEGENEGEVNLTIVAPGNPDFAASYQSSKNVFGLHDDMKDNDTADVPQNALFSYQIFGWFSDPENDPLNGIDSTDKLVSRLKELNWNLKDVDKLTTDIPGGIVCHAAINDVFWSEGTENTIPSVNNIEVGIGNSSSEALAALLPGHTGTDKAGLPDKLLAAFQYKSLVDNGLEGDGFNLVKKQVHSRSFLPVTGGTHWVVEPKEKKGTPQEGDEQDRSIIPFDTYVSKCLEKLNYLQTQYDTAVNQLRSLQAEMYALKYKKAFSGTDESDSGSYSKAEWHEIQSGLETTTDTTRDQIKKLIICINALKLKTGKDSDSFTNDYSGEIAEQYRQLENAMKQSKMDDFLIKEVPMPKFYEPADPAIVIAGLIDSSQKYLNKDAEVKCRIKNQLADKLEIGNRAINANNIATGQTNDQINEINGKVPDGITALIYESLLLTPFLAPLIAEKMDISDKVKDVREVISKFYSNPSGFKRNDKNAAYTPAAFCITIWKQPWNPLYLEWTLKWGSTYKNINPDVLSAWNFGDKKNQMEFKLDSKALYSAIAPVEYSGRTLISTQLASKISSLNAKLIQSLKSDLFNNFIPVSQTLSGFSSQLLMRYNGIQLPVVNDELILDPDWQFIGDQLSWSPMVNHKPFSPVRSGTFELSMLRVIDSFGQVLNIFDSTAKAAPKASPRLLKNSAGIPVAKPTSAEKLLRGDNARVYQFELAPRIIQPARLKFDWISANHPARVTDSDPATSPVCGWFLYNRLDKNISVYNAAGTEIGVLEKNGNRVVLSAPPGQAAAQKIDNPVLNNVVGHITNMQGAFNDVKKQMIAVNDKIQSKTSRQELTMSVPVAFPVAIVTAQFVIELRDRKAKDQSWKGTLTDKAFDDINCKANIGNAFNKSDGLTGYFLNGNYENFILPFGEKGISKNLKASTSVQFKTHEVQKLTLLIDPRAAVSISSGILPAATYELPQHVIKQSLKDIGLRFVATPIITPVGEIKVPLLRSNGLKWNFISGTEIIKDSVDDIEKKPLVFNKIHATEGWFKLTADKVEDKTVK